VVSRWIRTGGSRGARDDDVVYCRKTVDYADVFPAKCGRRRGRDGHRELAEVARAPGGAGAGSGAAAAAAARAGPGEISGEMSELPSSPPPPPPSSLSPPRGESPAQKEAEAAAAAKAAAAASEEHDVRSRKEAAVGVVVVAFVGAVVGLLALVYKSSVVTSSSSSPTDAGPLLASLSSSVSAWFARCARLAGSMLPRGARGAGNGGGDYSVMDTDAGFKPIGQWDDSL
jgi:hypothetical protein